MVNFVCLPSCARGCRLARGTLSGCACAGVSGSDQHFKRWTERSRAVLPDVGGTPQSTSTEGGGGADLLSALQLRHPPSPARRHGRSLPSDLQTPPVHPSALLGLQLAEGRSWGSSASVTL